MLLSPVIAISLPMIRATIQAGALPRDTSMISDVETRSLSARGSRNLPREDDALYFLAIYPSSRSVRDAIQKSAAEKILKSLPGDNKRRIKTGDTAILKSERVLGMLESIVFSFIIIITNYRLFNL